MNLFSRAAAGLNLTPGERALLKLLQSFLTAGAIAVLLAAPTFLAVQSGNVALATGGVAAAVGAFLHGFLTAWQKYVSAKGDAPLASALGAVDAAAQHALGQPNAVKTLADDAAAAPAPTPVSAAVAAPVVAQPS